MTLVRRLHLPQDRHTWRRLLVRSAAYLAGWAVVAVPVAVYGFLHDSRTTVIASHLAEVSPTTDGWATIDLGAYLPNVRYPAEGRLGVHIELGKTNLDSYDQLLERYALIASQPEGQIGKVEDLVVSMAWANALTGALVGLIGPGLWVLVGAQRRRELVAAARPRHAAVAVGTVGVVVAVSLLQPWRAPEETSAGDDAAWQPLATLLPGADIPDQAQPLEVQGGLMTTGTRQLVESALDTYRKSQEFYADLAARAAGLRPQLRQPTEDETVALVVSDRHDNVGMDKVARAIGDAGGATVLLDAGDDTSTGEEWEAFSLDSLVETYEDYDARFVALGNHDEGAFAGEYLNDRDFTVLTGEVVDGPDGMRVLGAPDPRSSGLGSWRNETEVTMDEQESLLAEAACAAADDGDRVSTLLVHDSTLGEAALERGCVDLVVGGHLHIQDGPTEVTGPAGEVGVHYVNGTTGGAAYAFALGSKLRRPAQVTLITYRDGRPVGLQPVDILTTGEFQVQSYVELPTADELDAAPARPGS